MDATLILPEELRGSFEEQREPRLKIGEGTTCMNLMDMNARIVEVHRNVSR